MGVEHADTSGMNGDESCYYDDCHFTEAGAAELARLIATRLLDRRQRPAAR